MKSPPHAEGLEFGAGTSSDRQLRWMQPILLKTRSHSEGCMGWHITVFS